MVKMGNVYPGIPEELMKLILGIDTDDTILESIVSGDLVTINKGSFKAVEVYLAILSGMSGRYCYSIC